MNSIADAIAIAVIGTSEVTAYVEKYAPTILTYDKNRNTQGFPGMNIGMAKGSTHDRVLIFPSGTMLKYVKTRDLASFREPSKLYVAVTRARFSATFVDPSG